MTNVDKRMIIAHTNPWGVIELCWAAAEYVDREDTIDNRMHAPICKQSNYIVSRAADPPPVSQLWTLLSPLPGKREQFAEEC